MARVDVDTLTMEQYLALSRENQAPGVVKPKIRGNVNFKIKSQFMRELREDTFSGNKDEDAHDHIDRVLSIVGLFNILGVTKDAVMLRVFPFTLTGAAKRWVDRLTPGTINTCGLLKKAFIQRLRILSGAKGIQNGVMKILMIKPRPRDYTFKEWVKLKKGHLDVSKSVRKDLFRLWVIDQFTEALDPYKDPLERCLDEYNWVFHKEIEQLSDEYEMKIREKGQVLEEIWTKCKRTRCKNKDWWYDYWYEDEEKMELGNEDYNPPMVHTETFEVTKYKFNNGYSVICVIRENNENLSLGRKNGSRFRKMIIEEMEEVLGNDKEDSDNET
ncbi:hypothetical protein Tco_0788347 [Tanacetum coccineum]